MTTSRSDDLARLRESAGVPALTLEQEVEAMDAESNDDANPLPEAEEDTDALP
jgi:hypothetical protein